MSELCACPNPATLESIADFNCPIDFSEIAKLIFSRKKKFQSVVHTTTPFPDPTETEIITLAEWVTTLAAADDEKSLVTPIVDDVENEPGAPIVEELTIRTVVTGFEPTVFTGFLSGAPQPTVASFKKLTCEKTLYVYFVDNDGNIIYNLNGAVPEGFKLSNNSFFMQDLELKKRTTNKNRLGFQLEPGWSDGAKKATPLDFDALIDLTN